MQNKVVDKQPVLFRSQRLTIPEIGLYAEKHCADIQDEATRRGLEIEGPWTFVSYSLPDNPSDAFQLDFCLPIVLADAVDDSVPSIKVLPAFPCASYSYQGPLAGIFPQGYAPLLHDIGQAKLALTGESREVYLQWDGPDSSENRIEIQFGCKA
ncbi:GyrI-like domain-containing protein [Paludibacterium purpuratum]|uniref:Effector-binding domain-containing protein n=1 Tax=Paludibacterium purpuratum TaxID=1144873 RepID=A0A4R7BAK3_9NEIS|nr:GyrI-like domain-containing protein [Paludibacterium purpuratum]TDR80677.1 hypothetical protein DFP86_104177 [Paludibacterium purpuratum]